MMEKQFVHDISLLIRERLNLKSPINIFDVLDACNIKYQAEKNLDIDVDFIHNVLIYDEHYSNKYLQFALACKLGYLLFYKFDNKFHLNLKHRIHQLKLHFLINEFAVCLLVPDDELIRFKSLPIKLLSNKFNVLSSVIIRRKKVLNI